MQPQRTLLCLTLIAGGLLSNAAAQAQTTAMVDQGLGTQVSSIQTDPGQPDNITIPILGGALLTVSSNGTRTAFSDFGNAAQGPIGSGSLGGMAWVPSGLLGLGGGTLAVTDAFAGSNGAGALFAVNPSNGQRTILSDFGNASQGPVGKTPVGVAYSNGLLGLGNTIYVIDNNAGTDNRGALFAIDPVTGARRVLSDFGDGEGAIGENPIALAIVPAGVLSVLGLNAGLVVLDDDAGTNGRGAIIAVNANTGLRTLLSDLGNVAQGPVAVGPQAITVTPTLLGYTIEVTDNAAGTNAQGALFAIDISGNRTLQSDFGNAVQGPQGLDPSGIAATADGSGNVLVTDNFGNQTPTLAQVFLVTPGGQRTIYSNCTVISLGPCQAPAAITQH